MKHILTIFTCGFFYATLLAQNFQVLPPFPSPQDNPVWQIYQNGVLKFITVGADTALCGNTWNPVIASSEQAGQAVTEPLGFYRMVGKKVYFREISSCASPEYLLYDFDVEVGDTVLAAYNFDAGAGGIIEFSVVVGFIQEFEIYGHTYRDIYLSGVIGTPPFAFPVLLRWLEVVGNYFHPFYLTTCLQDDGFCHSYSYVNCLSANEGVRFVGWPYPEVTCAYAPTLKRLYVDKQVEGGLQNGYDWPNAFSDLQDAIAIADPGDTIWVAQGTYLPTESANREIYFEMKPGVVILGGFNATETSQEQRNWEAYPTMLSGDIGISGDSTDNSYHLLYTLGTDSTSRIDGFTIAFGQGIHANSNYSGHYNGGGGLFVDTDGAYPTASPGIANCTFFRNTAKNGGAVHLKNGANPIFRNCAFRQNRSTLLGGGMYKDGTASEAHPFVLENCLFEQNRARAEGGGLALNNACENHWLLHCTFLKNYSMSTGGGIYYFSDCPEGGGEMKIEECLFEHNDADSGGGVGYIHGFSSSSEGVFKLAIVRSVFSNNNARSSDGGAINAGILWRPSFVLSIEECSFFNNTSLLPGGALYLLTDSDVPSNLSIKSTIFSGNRSTVEEGTGGAIMISGLFNQAFNNILIANSLFSKNSGVLRLTTGDGVLDASLRNCTFYDNGRRPFVKSWAPEFDEDFFLAMRFENCIIWEPNKPLNRLFTNGANVVMNGFSFRNSLLSVPACDLPGGLEACAENNLFNLYPRFLDTLAGDFRLAACSPAINAGTYTGLDTLEILTDLNGAARIQEGVEDMGAFEQPADTIHAIFQIQHASAAQVADGSLSLISIEGGVPPYGLFWGFGSTGDTLSNLLPGIYPVTVSDSSGCSVTYALEVSAPNASQQPLEENNNFRLWPHPFTGTVMLTIDHLPAAIQSTGMVLFYDAFGREVLREPLQPINGKIRQELDLAHLAAGAYFCAIEVNGIVQWHTTTLKQ